MATDYCFLKFICVRKSFKKHFPHLSLGVPAHQTKPPIWFSTAVNFAALVSTRLQGGKQQLRSVQFSILCLPASCQKLAWLAERPAFEVLSFFSFWHFKCCWGPPRLRTKFVRRRGQTRVSDAIAEENCHHQLGVTAGVCRGTPRELLLLIQSYLERVAAPAGAVAVWEQGWPQDRGTNGSCPQRTAPGSSSWCCGSKLESSLLVLLEGFVVLWGSLQPHLHSMCRKRDDI